MGLQGTVRQLDLGVNNQRLPESPRSYCESRAVCAILQCVNLYSAPGGNALLRMPNEPISASAPQFSVIIAVYNDWGPLDECLRSLELQSNRPGFEVIIVDDGSKEPAPEAIRASTRSYPMTIVRQAHAGIAAARNRGIQISSGSVLVFTDADCRLQTDCLAALSAVINDSPQTIYFQLRLTGSCSTVVGRAEQLRLVTLQTQMLLPSGCIRYLNTAGFAIRRTHVDIGAGLFDPKTRRAEDTLLLASLMQRGELPFFVTDAVVQHAVSLSLMECFRKDIRSAWLAGKTYDIIATKGVRVRMGYKGRLDMLLSAWKTARQDSIGRAAWFVLVSRQLFQRIGAYSYRYLRLRKSMEAPAGAS